jgi:ABC-type multidrug transport system ATPase subunit
MDTYNPRFCSPKVLILDEPTTGLDPELKHQVWDIIAKAR